ncbi:hypothetical protein [cf. Phormidesmis sp. LEGE 11477]|uniref:hypothetical protein n=1 Tax=cf. Phormidesmis sp. LEGE 11477 TaxID=1828680 RepID=UPI00187FBB49|nr:hypothetical protein [cf. Phormidesmis sp. LEGE 11477]MBE9064491.1 hypothetical protein [cf. Phormidesmis sp. LEGE 11477]
MQLSTRSLPEDVKLKFYAVLCGDESINDFEQWLYSSKQIEAVLHPDDYLNLLSLDYSSSLVRVNLIGILENLVSSGEYETYRVKQMLRDFLGQTKGIESSVKLLTEFYDLYCRGVSFLDSLGLNYGLSVVCLDVDSLAKRERYVESLLPDAKREARKVLHYLENGTVKILNTEQYSYYFRCLDHRRSD